MHLTSKAFSEGQAIPTKFTCEGDDVSPPLSFGSIPDGAKSLLLVVEDPDAPDPRAPQRTYVHWVLYDIPANATELAEGTTQLPKGSRVGMNDFQRARYGGPCPPIGRHRYFFKLYALDTVLGEFEHATKATVEKAMQNHVLAEAVLMGTYEKRAKRNTG